MTMSTRAFLAAFTLLFFLHSQPARAQAEDPPSPEAKPDSAGAAEADAEKPAAEPGTPRKHGWGNVEIEFSGWLAKPSGTQFTPVTYRSATLAGQTNVIEMTPDSELINNVRAGFVLPKGMGTVSGRYSAFSQQKKLVGSTPGTFGYGELQVVPYGAGLFEDGLADGFASHSRLDVRDWLIDLRRVAFDFPRFRGTWHAGVRGVSFRREMGSIYYALNPPPSLFPAVIPPNVPPTGGSRPDLIPLPDRGYVQSEFSGRGVDAGLDFLFPLNPSRSFAIEAGLSLAVMRGNLTTQFNSSTSSYILTSGATSRVLSAPYAELADNTQIASITQVSTPLGLNDDSGEGGASSLESYLGFRVRVWQTLNLFAGFRNVHYADTAAEVRLAAPVSLPGTTPNFVSRDVSPISTNFEGFYFGFGYTY